MLYYAAVLCFPTPSLSLPLSSRRVFVFPVLVAAEIFFPIAGNTTAFLYSTLGLVVFFSVFVLLV